MVRWWVVGFECDLGVMVRVRFITSFHVSNRLKMANRCGTCGKRAATLQETVRHHWHNHNEAALCVVRPIWDAEKGAHVYHRLKFKVTPETIPDASTLHVDDINWTIAPPSPSGIGPTPQQRQPKLSDTPVRCTTTQQVSFDVPEQLNQTIGYEQTDLLCDSLADMSLENRHLVQELITIFPDVAKNLDASGKLHDWGKALKMIKDNKLPLDNIAHELFFDVFQWYDLDHPGMMRYSPRVKQFWSIGYKLFKERWKNRWYKLYILNIYIYLFVYGLYFYTDYIQSILHFMLFLFTWIQFLSL